MNKNFMKKLVRETHYTPKTSSGPTELRAFQSIITYFARSVIGAFSLSFFGLLIVPLLFPDFSTRTLWCLFIINTVAIIILVMVLVRAEKSGV